MRKDLELKLVEKYPALFEEYGGDPRQTCMAWGCSHGDGWFEILSSLCEQIQQYVNANPGMAVKFLQIKEKFAVLTVYHNGDSTVDKIVDQHAEWSRRTCEECGEAGETRTIGGFYLTRCQRCHDIEDKRRS